MHVYCWRHPEVASLRSRRVHAGMVVKKDDIPLQPHREEGSHAPGASDQETHGEFRPRGRAKR